MVYLNSRNYFVVLSTVLLFDTIQSRPLAPLLFSNRDVSITSSKTIQEENLQTRSHIPIELINNQKREESSSKDPKEFGRLSSNHGMAVHAFTENELSSLRNPNRKRDGNEKQNGFIKREDHDDDGENGVGELSDDSSLIADPMYPLRVRNKIWKRYPFPDGTHWQPNPAHGQGGQKVYWSGQVQDQSSATPATPATVTSAGENSTQQPNDQNIRKRSKRSIRSIRLKRADHEDEESNHHWTTDDENGLGTYWKGNGKSSKSIHSNQEEGEEKQKRSLTSFQTDSTVSTKHRRDFHVKSDNESNGKQSDHSESDEEEKRKLNTHRLFGRSPNDQSHNVNQHHNVNQDHNKNQHHNTPGGKANTEGGEGGGAAGEGTDGNTVASASPQTVTGQGTEKESTEAIQTNTAGTEAVNKVAPTESEQQGNQNQTPEKRGESMSTNTLNRRTPNDQSHNTHQHHNINQDHNLNQHHNINQSHNSLTGGSGYSGGGGSGAGGEEGGATVQSNTANLGSGGGAGGGGGENEQKNNVTPAQSAPEEQAAGGGQDGAAKKRREMSEIESTIIIEKRNLMEKRQVLPIRKSKLIRRNPNDQPHNANQDHNLNQVHNTHQAHNTPKGGDGTTGIQQVEAGQQGTTSTDPNNIGGSGGDAAGGGGETKTETPTEANPQPQPQQEQANAEKRSIFLTKRDNVSLEKSNKKVKRQANNHWTSLLPHESEEGVNPVLGTYFHHSNANQKRLEFIQKRIDLIKRQDLEEENPYLSTQEMDDDSSSDIDKKVPAEKPDHVEGLENQHDECMENEKQGVIPSGTCEAQRMSSALAGSVRKREEGNEVNQIGNRTTTSTSSSEIAPPTSVRPPSQTDLALEALQKLSDLQAKRNDVQEQEKLIENQIHDLFKQYPVLSATLAL